MGARDTGRTKSNGRSGAAKTPSRSAAKSSARSTVSGPARSDASDVADALMERMQAVEGVAAAVPLALAEGADLVENAGAPSVLPSGEPDPGILVGRHATAGDLLPAFVQAVGKHRHFERQMDPPEL